MTNLLRTVLAASSGILSPVHGKSVRIGVVLFGLLATAGLGYRAVLDEDGLSASSAAATPRSIARRKKRSPRWRNLRASAPCLRGPGPGAGLLGGRAATALLDTLREQLLALDAALAASGGSLADSLDGLDQLAAAEKRARHYADRGESCSPAT